MMTTAHKYTVLHKKNGKCKKLLINIKYSPNRMVNDEDFKNIQCSPK